MFLVTPAFGKPRGSLLLAHGAGTPMDSPFMDRAARALAQTGLTVYRYEFAYMAQRRSSPRRPPPARFERLQAELRQIFSAWDAPPPHYLGGKSMGSRVSLSLLAELPVEGGIALGYPFHPPGQPEKTRWHQIQPGSRKCLILMGTRDPFGSPEEVADYPLPASTTLRWLSGADHDFAVSKSSPEPFAQVTLHGSDWLGQRHEGNS